LQIAGEVCGFQLSEGQEHEVSQMTQIKSLRRG